MDSRLNVCVHPRRTLCAVVVERLVGPDFFIFLSEREGEGGKWTENAKNRPVRAVRGHFGPIIHPFSVLEPSRGHICINFLLKSGVAVVSAPLRDPSRRIFIS